jgi:uncharacterized repeat protein (TIGR03843 family)
MADVPDTARMLSLLTCGTMREEHGMLRWSSNYTFLVSIADEDLKTMAVYKPQRGERPLWDFPDGTLCYREVSAYVMSDALGWRIVPPTVLRDGLRGLGSVQLYVNNNPDVNYFSLDESHLDQLRRVAAFDYLINNADRKGGHVLMDDTGHLWGIDHGIGFHVAPKLRTVIWDFAGQPVPETIVEDVQRVTLQVEDPCTRLRMELSKLLAEAEIHSLLARMRRFVQRREYPRPGPGPNYPWPPV